MSVWVLGYLLNGSALDMMLSGSWNPIAVENDKYTMPVRPCAVE